jgi:hypothetical protein
VLVLETANNFGSINLQALVDGDLFYRQDKRMQQQKFHTDMSNN